MNQKINEKVFNSFPELESERLLFREFTTDYAPDIYFVKSDELMMKYMDAPKHKSIDEAIKYIETIRQDYKDKKGVHWVILEKESREMIGFISYWRLDRPHIRAEIGYALKPTFWGKGYMSESLRRVINFGFNDLQLHSIEANIHPSNTNSKRVLKTAGFQKEAYFRENYFFNGVFTDSEIYCLLESDIR